VSDGEADQKVLADGAEQLAGLAEDVMRRASGRRLTFATAESCTGGLLASLLTDIQGLGGCFDRGFVTYTEEAKADQLGIDPSLIERHTAVSREVALAMAQGALDHSNADLAVGITGYAGPAKNEDVEEGLVHIAVAARDGPTIHRECHFGEIGRDATRHEATRTALEMLDELIERLD
jgi:nicotinamide-nucleotide amidase